MVDSRAVRGLTLISSVLPQIFNKLEWISGIILYKVNIPGTYLVSLGTSGVLERNKKILIKDSLHKRTT